MLRHFHGKINYLYLRFFIQKLSNPLMKKLLTFSLFLSFVISMQAQEHRVSAGVSFGTLSQFHRALSGIISEILQDSNSIYRKETVNMGDFRVSYLYIPEGKINFGGTFSYNH